MDKSLTPLIVIFTIIIFLTIVILNSDVGEKRKDKKSSSGIPHMELKVSGGNHNYYNRTKRVVDSDNLKFSSAAEIRKAKKFLAEKKEKKAEDILRTVLVLEPENMNALTLLGGIFYYSGRYREAEDIFNQQIRIDPDSYLAYNKLASTQAKQNRLNDAIKTNSKALYLNPESPEVNINLAGMYSLIGKKEQAMTHFEKAYKSFGYAILPFSNDSAFDNIRHTPEFQAILEKARQELQKNNNNKTDSAEQ